MYFVKQVVTFELLLGDVLVLGLLLVPSLSFVLLLLVAVVVLALLLVPSSCFLLLGKPHPPLLLYEGSFGGISAVAVVHFDG